MAYAAMSNQFVIDYLSSKLEGADPSDPALPEDPLTSDVGDAQVNFHDEAAVSVLEDAALVEHIRAARARYHEAADASAALCEKDVRLEFTTCVGELSEILSALREAIPVINRYATEVLISSRHIPKAMRGVGVEPYFAKHGLPREVAALPQVKSLADLVESHLKLQGSALTDNVDAIDQVVNRFSNAHVKFSNAFGNMSHVLSSYRDEIAKQRELIDAAAALYDYDEVKANHQRDEIFTILKLKPKAANVAANVAANEAANEAAPVAKIECAAPSYTPMALTTDAAIENLKLLAIILLCPVILTIIQYFNLAGAPQ